jgi:hemerythrin-like domain-containing protein
MKITVLLRKDHETVRSLFTRYKKAAGRPQNGKNEIFEDIRREIMIHSQMETEIFYPALGATTSPRSAELLTSAMEEHGVVEKLLRELSATNGHDRQFEAKMTSLIDLVNEHIDKEEEEIFEEARQNLPEYRLEELGLEMEDRRKILTQLAA